MRKTAHPCPLLPAFWLFARILVRNSRLALFCPVLEVHSHIRLIRYKSFFDLFCVLEFRIKIDFGVVCYFPSSPTMPLLSHVESALATMVVCSVLLISSRSYIVRCCGCCAFAGTISRSISQCSVAPSSSPKEGQ